MRHTCHLVAEAARTPDLGHALHQDKLVRIAKKLKKNNVAVDVVAFGSEGEDANAEKLVAFREAVNSGDNSHLVTVPAGTVLSDMLFSSPIFQVAHATLLCFWELRRRDLRVEQGTLRKQEPCINEKPRPSKCSPAF